MGIEQFFDAFCLEPKRPWRTAACLALDLPDGQIAEDAQMRPSVQDKFTLTPRSIPGDSWTETKPTKDDVPMPAAEESEEDAESGWSVASDSSDTDSDGTMPDDASVASDHDRFDAAYDAFGDLHEGLYQIDNKQLARGVTSEDAPGVSLPGGSEKLRELVHLPRNWPLARLMIPLGGLCQQVDRLLEGYCYQIVATNRDPERHHEQVVQAAKYLTLQMAEYLADTLAWLMRSILEHDSKILFDTDTEPLLTPGFWLLPLYRELLNSASRHRPSAASERARGCTGLVKIICKENKEQRSKRKYHEGSARPRDNGGFAQWFGSSSLIATLYIWFPASWAPLVTEKLFERSPKIDDPSKDSRSGQPVRGLTQPLSSERDWHLPCNVRDAGEAATEADSYAVHYKIRKWALDGTAIVPVLNATSRVNWLELDDQNFLAGLGVLREGILCDVYSQKCSAAWQGARPQRMTVSIMLPGRQSADDWLDFMLSQRNLWPTYSPKGAPIEMLTEQTLRRERRKLQAKHLWLDVKVQFHLLGNRMHASAPTGLTRQQLEELLFCRSTKENLTNPYEQQEYRGPRREEVRYLWDQAKQWMANYKHYCVPPSMPFNGLIRAFHAKEEEARATIDSFMHYCAKRWQTREGTYQLKRRKLLPDVRDPPGHVEMDVDMSDL